MDDNLRIWRSFSIGTLFDLIMLDTRDYDRSITDLYWNTDYIHQISNDAGRSMMGSRQENWFYNQLSASQARGATWRLIGSQTVFSRQNESIVAGNKSKYHPQPARHHAKPLQIPSTTTHGTAINPTETEPSNTSTKTT